MGKVAAFGVDGHFLAAVPKGYADRAIARGEVRKEGSGVRLRSAPGINALSPEAKRRIHLAKQRRS